MFEYHQPLRFEIYYVDSKSDSLKKHDFIGYAETSVQYLVNNLDQEVAIELKHETKNNKRGQKIFTAQ